MSTRAYAESPGAGSRARTRAARGWWFWELLKEEMEPYPGRWSAVARIVISATVVMLLIMTFRIPGAALGAYYAFVLPRDGPLATFKAALISVAAFVCGTAVVLLGVILFIDSPVTHFLWVIASLFLSFYVLSITRVYSAASGFGFLTTISIAIWDRQASSNLKVEATLFTLLAVVLGLAVTVAVEFIFAATHRRDTVLAGIIERLRVVQRLLREFAAGEHADPTVQRQLRQYAGIGTGHLREVMVRTNYEPEYKGQLGAALSLSGRLVDIAHNFLEAGIEPAEMDRARLARIADEMEQLRQHFLRQEVPQLLPLEMPGSFSERVPLLAELDRNVRLMSQVFSGHAFEEHLPVPGENAPTRLFAPDAFSNTAHIKFAIRGCLAASLCYIFYNATAWPGLNTSLATCVITAMTTVGASRQKQILRVSGALIGGCVFGFGAQAFLLPHMDSISQFTVLFAAITAVSAWVATASPRLSYCGLQIALAWYLSNLNEFTIDRSLGVARDRVLGILLGLSAMWLVFDQLWATPAVVAMQSLFVANLRRIARFAARPLGAELRRAPDRLWRERDAINGAFSNVRSQADGVLFEFRPQRERDLRLRDCVRAWQPELRTLFMVKLGLLQFRLRARDGALPALAERVQTQVAAMLEGIAGLVERGEDSGLEEQARSLGELRDQVLRAEQSAGEDSHPHASTVLTLSHSMLLLAESFYRDVKGCGRTA
jgi:multidrug resistance protein MdtO